MNNKYLCASFFLCLLFAACSRTHTTESNDTFVVKVLGINDFHGQVLPDDGEGGMQQLGPALLQSLATDQRPTFILHGGDQVGASPAESSLLQDEPSIQFLNLINSYCQQYRLFRCQVLGTAGNHEFDEGSEEMLRLLHGGIHAKGPFLDTHWQGANYKTLSANVIDKSTNSLLLEPYSIQKVNGVGIGIIGISLDTTPVEVTRGTVDNLVFVDQTEAVERYAAVLQKKGVETIIVIVHDGDESNTNYYSGETQDDNFIPLNSHFGQFVKKLPDSIDLVVSGHSHFFTNAYVTTDTGNKLLVTQAYSKGRAYADIELTINKVSGDVENASAKIVKLDANTSYSLSEAETLQTNKIDLLVKAATNFALRYTATFINSYSPVEKQNSLGTFIADSHRYGLKTDVGVMNEGGVRAELKGGDVTWGDIYAIQPFGNSLMVRLYSGKQLKQLVSTVHFWSSNLVVSDNGNITLDGKTIVDTNVYSVAGNNYVMNLPLFDEGEWVSSNGNDLDETINYIKHLPTPFNLTSKPKD
ncbi:bifunctional metallophosphatase/5'-nucleotidase [Alteromonas sp. 5E99-2]|uniref:bifunctional metallophosphatase/5'-nucleotidase n=1 Tax=Alteromonas sp. 5E99-2 TaxID=2817683 RepID=UPI001A991678|nr:bifunctional metallophosphatase/5'-nucleotidase [Alteromonas sp. 5E99-2]MBO1254429.1 bifunctional metallophosphatase/5'-nucleotidase [Alteromonas sp. 5E99-2]